MRKIYYFIFLCIALPSFLAGCNKDEAESEPVTPALTPMHQMYNLCYQEELEIIILWTWDARRTSGKVWQRCRQTLTLDGTRHRHGNPRKRHGISRLLCYAEGLGSLQAGRTIRTVVNIKRWAGILLGKSAHYVSISTPRSAKENDLSKSQSFFLHSLVRYLGFFLYLRNQIIKNLW